MRKLIIICLFIGIIISCNKKTENVQFDLHNFPKDWVKLTSSSKGLIIYNDCEMGNLLMTIKHDKDKYGLLLHGTQEDDEFEILGVLEQKDTIKFSTKRKDSDQKQTFNFIWINKQKGLGKWVTQYEESGYLSNFNFVTSEMQKTFLIAEQPCVECWGEKCDDLD